jgi:hypothetical protein
MNEAIGEDFGVRAQSFIGSKQHGAASEVFNGCSGRPQAHVANEMAPFDRWRAPLCISWLQIRTHRVPVLSQTRVIHLQFGSA